MTVAEKRVMDLWDGGSSIEAIVLETSLKRKYVYRVINRFTGNDTEDEYDEPAIRAASDQLLERIQAAGLCAV